MPETICLTDLEAAINHWRTLPAASGTALALCPELEALAEVYGHAIWAGSEAVATEAMPGMAYAAWLAWYATTPDTPCIAICSTSQGDAVCKGCGRTFDEVQHWPGMSPAAKRACWHRIVREGTALRFNRYAERAGGNACCPPDPA